ncbi:hypothetical protein ATN92_16810 [Companilactobacillus bobalius]|nr:hypothetical protein ATN92_16810 [Companilactobacillus bobalius]
MLFILCGNWIIKAIGKRNTVILGLFVAMIGGVGPAFVTNITMIKVLRFLFGAGTGIYTSLAVSLIGDYFTGDEQRNLLGIQSAVSALGSSLSTFLAGILVGINWQSTYLVYLILLPVLIVFMIGFPKKDSTDSQKTVTVENESSGKQSKKLPIFVIIGILVLFVYFNAVMAMYTNSGLALQQMQVKNQGMLGTALAFAGIIGSLITMLYGPIFKALKHFTPIIACGIGAVGFFGMAHSSNMILFTISMILVSSTTILIPYVYGTVMDSVPEASKNFAISVAMIFNNLGAYFSPYSLSFIGKASGMTDPTSSFVICAVVMIVLAVVFVFMQLNRNKNVNTSMAK